jgi:hypothetical protein
MHRYRGLLARHLYFRGQNRHVVSKNPSFTCWVSELQNEFPDARFIGLRRDPAQSLPSQLSSITSGLRLFGHDVKTPEIVAAFLLLYRTYWQSLESYADQGDLERFRLLEYERLKEPGCCWLSTVLDDFGYRLSETDLRQLQTNVAHSRDFRSRHRYTPEQFGLNADAIRLYVTGCCNDGMVAATSAENKLVQSHDPPIAHPLGL